MIDKNKTLFNSNGKGLPIGNLPSQMFANVYMNVLGLYVLNKLHIPIFIYVDDFIIFCFDREILKQDIKWIEQFLMNKLGLRLHKGKRYLQHFTKGYRFVGGVVKPYRTYITNEIKYRFYNNLDDNSKFISYCGLMGHHKTYNIRKNIWHLILEMTK